MIRPRDIERYLRAVLDPEVRLERVQPLGQPHAADLKAYGYGQPLRVRARSPRRRWDLVLETVKPGPFGHEHLADRAHSLIWNHAVFNRLPRHVRSLDVGAFVAGKPPVSLGRAREFFHVTEYAPGAGYNEDLDRIARTGRLMPGDRRRALALADYLAGIHARKKRASNLYRRRLRELIGHGECIMGLTDSYPLPFGFITAELLQRIETLANAWRWRLHARGARLCQVHGDFHPYNILFRKGTDFSVLDRSRGEWGEAADDLTGLSINYLLQGLRRDGALAGAFERLFRTFWERYLARTGDSGVLEAAAPFFAFRGLVVANPVWYPRLPLAVRRKLFNFILNVLQRPRFDPAAVNALLREP